MKKCPFTRDDLGLFACIEEECALWDNMTDMCAFLSIANEIEKLRGSVDDLSKKS